MFSMEQRQALLKYAAAVIRHRLDGSACVPPDDSAFEQKRGIFVSLHEHGELRGCIGYVLPYKNIVDSLKEMAQAAAFRDPRFKPVVIEDLHDLQIEISILSELIPLHNISEIEIGRDGLYIDHPQGSGLLLPQVAVEWKWDAKEYLHHLTQKADLEPSAYKDPQAMLYRFEAEIFSEQL